MEGRYVEDSCTEQVYVVMPQHLNGYGRLFGGQLAMWIDVVAGVTAVRHCRRVITTAAIDNLRFHAPVTQNEVVVMRGRVTYTGVTSVEVRVDSYVENMRTGENTLINTAFVTQVALGDDGKPCPVPPIIPRTDEERQAFVAGEKRREMRRRKPELFE